MENMETSELVQSLDRRTFLHQGEEAALETLRSRGIEYRPYGERVDAGVMTAALELKRRLDRNFTPRLLEEMAKIAIIEGRFERGYLDVRLYPFSELSSDEDEPGRLFVSVTFVLAVPENDSLDTLSRWEIVSLLDESSELEASKALTAALNATALSKAVSDLSFQGWSASDFASIRWSFEVDGCRASLFEAREREARGLAPTLQHFYVGAGFDAGEIEFELQEADEELDLDVCTPEEKRSLFEASETVITQGKQLEMVAGVMGLASPRTRLSISDSGWCKLLCHGLSPWTLYDFDDVLLELSGEHDIEFSVTDVGALQFQSYCSGEYDSGGISSDYDYSKDVVADSPGFAELFNIDSDAEALNPWTRPGIEAEYQEVTAENAEETAPILICKMAEALGVGHLDPALLKPADHLYRLVNSDDLKGQSLERSLSLHFNILAGADLVTVADVIMLAEELRPEE